MLDDVKSYCCLSQGQWWELNDLIGAFERSAHELQGFLSGLDIEWRESLEGASDDPEITGAARDRLGKVSDWFHALDMVLGEYMDVHDLGDLVEDEDLDDDDEEEDSRSAPAVEEHREERP